MPAYQPIACETFPCSGVEHQAYSMPAAPIDPAAVRIVMISECAPADPADGYYGGDEALFARTTVQAFRDAGASVSCLQDVLDLGVYLTTAIKCGKIGYNIKAAPIKTCSELLEREIAPFTGTVAWMLMGDVAIRALNYIARRAGQPRVIPAGSTYKIRGAAYSFRGARAFPSYLQAGPSYFIEKSKRTMIAEDIAAALRLIA
jgi:hypothetical protein